MEPQLELYPQISPPARILFEAILAGPITFRSIERNGTSRSIINAIETLTGRPRPKGKTDQRAAVCLAVAELCLFYPALRVSKVSGAQVFEFAKITKQHIVDTNNLLRGKDYIPLMENFQPQTPGASVLINVFKSFIAPQLRDRTKSTVFFRLLELLGSPNLPTLVEQAVTDASFQEWRFLFMDDKIKQAVIAAKKPRPDPMGILAHECTKTIPELEAAAKPNSRAIIRKCTHVDLIKAGDLLTKEGRVAFFALLGADADQPMLIRANAVKEIGRIHGDYDIDKNRHAKPSIFVNIAGRQQGLALSTNGEAVSITDQEESQDRYQQPVIELVQ